MKWLLLFKKNKKIKKLNFEASIIYIIERAWTINETKN